MSKVLVKSGRGSDEPTKASFPSLFEARAQGPVGSLTQTWPGRLPASPIPRSWYSSLMSRQVIDLVKPHALELKNG